MTTHSPDTAASLSDPRDAVLVHLVQRLLNDTDDDCTLVGFSGTGRCLEPAVALRWEDGHTDLVCEEHARRAERRGTLTVYPTRTGAHPISTPAPGPKPLTASFADAAVHTRVEYGAIVDRTSRGLGYLLAATSEDLGRAQQAAETAAAQYGYPAHVEKRLKKTTTWQPLGQPTIPERAGSADD